MIVGHSRDLGVVDCVGCCLFVRNSISVVYLILVQKIKIWDEGNRETKFDILLLLSLGTCVCSPDANST